MYFADIVIQFSQEFYFADLGKLNFSLESLILQI